MGNTSAWLLNSATTIVNQKIYSLIAKNPYATALILIILVSLFFRTYQIVDRFEFAHDGDLYSWIVKDIVVDGHLRLIGQETSAQGVFIGPLFYYMLIPFFLLFKMDPIGAVIPVVAIGVLTTLSYYIVFSRLWSRGVGLIAAFLQAVLLSSVYFDQRVVPSTPTNLWVIWYFYTVVSLARGNFKVLWLVGLLAGLVWHIHIALLPALIAVPAAMLLAKTWPSKKQLALFTLSLALASLPLLAFELRHNFSQTKGIVANFTTVHGPDTAGLNKLNLVLIKITSNIDRLFFYPQGFPANKLLLFLGLLALGLFLVKNKLLSAKEVVVFYLWIAAIVLFFGLSSSILSEYYFANIEVIFVAIVSLLFAYLISRGKAARYAVVGILALVLTKNLYFYAGENIYQKGYNERKLIAEFITGNSRAKSFPCIAVSYITGPGDNVGFRYFFWLNNLHVNQPISGAPVYTIVYPIELAAEAVVFRAGQIGVIPPESVPAPQMLNEVCSGQNSNLTDSLFGFTR